MQSNKRKSLSDAWHTLELNTALEKGYRVCETYEVWHFEWRGKTLSLDDVKLHLCQKQEASGCPAWCADADKKKKKKAKYVEDYRQKKDAFLQLEHIK